MFKIWTKINTKETKQKITILLSKNNQKITKYIDGKSIPNNLINFINSHYNYRWIASQNLSSYILSIIEKDDGDKCANLDVIIVMTTLIMVSKNLTTLLKTIMLKLKKKKIHESKK